MDKIGAVSANGVAGQCAAGPPQPFSCKRVLVADALSRLLRFAGPTAEPYRPNSPLGLSPGRDERCAAGTFVGGFGRAPLLTAGQIHFTKTGCNRCLGNMDHFRQSSLPAFASLYENIITVAGRPHR